MAYGIKLNKPVRTVAAILVADVTGTFIVVCAAWIIASWENFIKAPLPSLVPAAALSGMLCGIGLVVWLFAGIPIHMAWIDRGKVSLWRYVLPAAVFGLLTGLIYVPLFPLTGSVGGLIGTANALIFWLIRRPDRDTIAATKAIKTA